eukprot:scaffold12082_cov105-Skeletonema_dohrnii-CCMP3373.AAC.2
MKNIGIGDSHQDFLFVNDALSSDADHFSNLIDIETRYSAAHPAIAIEGYRQLLHQADSKVDWRYRIARWMLRVADEFFLKRDTGAAPKRSIPSRCNNLSLRCLKAISKATPQGVCSELIPLEYDTFIVVSPLFSHTTKLLLRPFPKQLVLYTKNAFQREDILAMEQELLRTHKSFFFPPTSSTFVVILLQQLQDYRESPAVIASIIESCQFMIELAACDFFFVAHRASTIAVAAIVVTLEIEAIKDKVSPEAITSCLSDIKAKIDYTTDAAAQECIGKMRAVHSHNAQRIKDLEEKSTDDEVAKYTTGKEADPNASRAATPSPTDPCQCNPDTSSPPIIADEGACSNGSRKRQRRSSPSIKIDIV